MNLRRRRSPAGFVSGRNQDTRARLLRGQVVAPDDAPGRPQVVERRITAGFPRSQFPAHVDAEAGELVVVEDAVLEPVVAVSRVGTWQSNIGSRTPPRLDSIPFPTRPPVAGTNWSA